MGGLRSRFKPVRPHKYAYIMLGDGELTWLLYLPSAIHATSTDAVLVTLDSPVSPSIRSDCGIL